MSELLIWLTILVVASCSALIAYKLYRLFRKKRCQSWQAMLVAAAAFVFSFVGIMTVILFIYLSQVPFER